MLFTRFVLKEIVQYEIVIFTDMNLPNKFISRNFKKTYTYKYIIYRIVGGKNSESHSRFVAIIFK